VGQLAGIRLRGVGTYLPGPPLDQSKVRSILRRYRDGLSEAMQERLLAETGITTRHFAFDAASERSLETNTSMAAEAGRRAMQAAGWQPTDVDLLVVTTIVPDHLMPPTSTLVQEALEIPRCAEVEISANCSAPYKGLAFAVTHLRVGQYRRALICNSQLISAVLFPPWVNSERFEFDQGHLRWIVSDGAGAFALEAGDQDTEMRVWLESVGVGKPAGMSLPLGAASPNVEHAFSTGLQHVTQPARYALREGFRLAVEGVGRFLADMQIDGSEIDHFIPTVSSMQVADKLREIYRDRFGIRPDAWRLSLDRHGYVGPVALPLVLEELWQSGSLRTSDLICSVAEESSKWMCAGLAFRWNP
jgi:3-oxoacyl-[acyl-carrier-protein] synthase-3